MTKLINEPSNYVDEMLAGLVAAHPSLLLSGPAGRVIAKATRKSGKVGIASGGGAGHLPLFCGYVGEGLLDSCAVGNVFEGPNLDACVESVRAADQGAGVLLLFGNYGGDRMNFRMAEEMLAADGLELATVLGTDDIASAPPTTRDKRRGVAGILYAYKAAGAAAERGAPLKEVARIAQKAVDHTRTIGVGLASCVVPGAAHPTFSLAQGEIEMGIGIHGEPGIWKAPLRSADEIVGEMIERLLNDGHAVSERRVSILVNGLGATPLEELFIHFQRAHELLQAKGFSILRPMVGSYVTSMEMAGMSISLHFLDTELEDLLTAPASCPFWNVTART